MTDVCTECDGEGKVTCGGISSSDDGAQEKPCPKCSSGNEDEHMNDIKKFKNTGKNGDPG